jgi:PhzF family phenazine biosynthesis protein
MLRDRVFAVLRQYIVDAFERGPFTGNPAAVVPLEAWPDDSVLLQIAEENNLSETAYFVPDGDDLELRWFTPSVEVPLCGHATLASAHVLFEELGDPRERLRFRTLSGNLDVVRGDGGYVLDFPAGFTKPASEEVEASVREVLNDAAAEVYVSYGSPFAVVQSDAALRELSPDQAAIAELPRGHLLVSAPADSEEFDIVARVFAPGVGIAEDPATGSAHCAFAPFWSERLALETVRSFQASARGGYLNCRWREADRRVDISGRCRTFARAEIVVPEN